MDNIEQALDDLRQKKFSSILYFTKTIKSDEITKLTEILYNLFGKRDDIEEFSKWVVNCSISKTSI